MPFSHNRLKNTTGIQVFSQLNKYTLYYRFSNGNVQGCVFAKNCQVSLNWTDYTYYFDVQRIYEAAFNQLAALDMCL